MLFTTDNPIKDLSIEECLNLICQFAECGIREISLTAGEPLVRDDLYELIQACTVKNIRVSDIYTNGALLTTEAIEKILSIGQRPDFYISYDGVGWHDWVRGVEGAQDCAEEAIRTAHAYGLRITALAKNPSSPIPRHPCPSMSAVLYISATGTVLPCMEFVGVPEFESFPNLWDMPLTDVLKDSIWLQTTQITMNDVYVKNPQCQQCSEWGIHCGIHCRAHAESGFYRLDTDLIRTPVSL